MVVLERWLSTRRRTYNHNKEGVANFFRPFLLSSSSTITGARAGTESDTATVVNGIYKMLMLVL